MSSRRGLAAHSPVWPVGYWRSPGDLACLVTRSIGDGFGSWGQGLVQAGEPGDEVAQAGHGDGPQNAAAVGTTRRSPPPSARARLCASASALNPAESQNRVRVMSTTTVACPRLRFEQPDPQLLSVADVDLFGGFYHGARR